MSLGILAVGGERQLWHWSTPSAAPTRLLEAPGAICAFAPAPVGEQVALVVADDRGSARLLLFDAQRGPSTLAEGVPSDARLAWSPSGRHVAVALGARGIGVASAPLRALVVLQGAPADADPFWWDSDGLVVEEQHPLKKLRSDYCRLSGAFGAPVRVEPLPGPCWQSPDGSLRVRGCGDALERADQDGWHQVTQGVDALTVVAAPWVGSGHWALDDALLDLRTGERRAFLPGALAFHGASRDGRLVLCRDRDEQLVVLSLPQDLGSLPTHRPRSTPAPRTAAAPPPLRPEVRQALDALLQPENAAPAPTSAGSWMIAFQCERTRAHRAWVERGCQGEGRIALEGSDLSKARAQGAFLVAARFRACDLSDAHLALARLNDVELVGCSLARATLHGAVVAGAKLEGCSLQDADLSIADLSWSRVAGCDFRRALLDKSRWRGAIVEDCDFGGARIWDARLDGGRFLRCGFRDADLSRQDRSLDRCTTTDAELVDCDLSGADLDGRRLRGTVFRRCRLQGVRGTPVLEGPCQAIDCWDVPGWLRD